MCKWLIKLRRVYRFMFEFSFLTYLANEKYELLSTFLSFFF